MGVLTFQVLPVLFSPIARSAVVEASSLAPADDSSTNLWLVIALTLLGSSVVAGLITSVLGNLRAAATARREGYANAVRSLIARAEYPYRVRRRVSDDPDVLAALVARGNDLQEQLAACRTWVCSEHRVIGRLFEQALANIDSTVNPTTTDAWNRKPITTAAGMNLAGWEAGDPWPHLVSLERAITYRFGWEWEFDATTPRGSSIKPRSARSLSRAPSVCRGATWVVTMKPDRGPASLP